MRTATISKALIVLAALVLLSAPLMLAQRRAGGTGAPRYDPATEISFKGSVERVKEIAGPGRGTGTHLTVKTDSQTWDVHLGPSSFLAEKQFAISEGDRIEVTGSKVKYEGAEIIVAREVKKGDQVLALRNAAGIPQWSRRSRR